MQMFKYSVDDERVRILGLTIYTKSRINIQLFKSDQILSKYALLVQYILFPGIVEDLR